MKLTKKLEAEILEVNSIYWESFVKGDWKKIVSLLDDNITMIGSAEHEVFHHKKLAAKFFKDSLADIAGKIELRNKKTELVPAGPVVIINEQVDLYISTGGQ